jgi:hypothetical protein
MSVTAEQRTKLAKLAEQIFSEQFYGLRNGIKMDRASLHTLRTLSRPEMYVFIEIFLVTTPDLKNSRGKSLKCTWSFSGKKKNSKARNGRR